MLLTALAAVAAAWGEQRVRIEELEEKARRQAEAAQLVERVDERTQQMLQRQDRQEQLLLEILRRLGDGTGGD